MLLAALSSIACWRAGRSVECEERERGQQFGGLREALQEQCNVSAEVIR